MMCKKQFYLICCLGMLATGRGMAQQTYNLSISELFERVEQNSKSLREQKTGISAATEGVKAAKSQRLPDINTQVSTSFIGNVLMSDRDFSNMHGMSSPHFGNQLLVDAQQTVYAGGAITAGIRLSELGLEQAALSAASTREQERFVALSQYLELQKLDHRERVIDSNITLTQQLIDNTRVRFQQGTALENDITRYELQQQRLRLEKTKIQNQRSILNHQLCNTLGIEEEEAVIHPAEDMTTKTFATETESLWQQDAKSHAPMLQMAGVQTKMARQQEKLAKSELLPKVAIVAENNFNGPITFELPPVDKNLNVWFVGVGVKYSLSSLFKNNKRLHQARFETQRSQEQQAVAEEHLNNLVQQAYTNYLQSYVELDTQEKNVQLATQNYQVMNERYMNQLALVTDMVDASNQKLQAELDEVDARINIAYAYYKIMYIAGKL